jgi:hypothetical protein
VEIAAVTKFYVSPSCLSFRQYTDIVDQISRFGWSPTWAWPHDSFHLDFVVKKNILLKVLYAISTADIFIAFVPGTPSTILETGIAYTLCEECILVAANDVFFSKTGAADAHFSVLPGFRRLCCTPEELPAALHNNYLYLVESG